MNINPLELFSEHLGFSSRILRGEKGARTFGRGLCFLYYYAKKFGKASTAEIIVDVLGLLDILAVLSGDGDAGGGGEGGEGGTGYQKW